MILQFILIFCIYIYGLTVSNLVLQGNDTVKSFQLYPEKKRHGLTPINSINYTYMFLNPL